MGAAVLLTLSAIAAIRALWPPVRDAETTTPRTLELLLLETGSDRPLAQVPVRFDGIPAFPLGGGRYVAPVPDGATVTAVHAEGYRPAALPARRDAGLVLRLVPAVVRGQIRAVDGSPVVRATIRMGNLAVESDAGGQFTLTEVPAGPQLEIIAPGYQRAAVPVGDQIDLTVQLVPQELRGAYLSFYGVADDGIRANVLEMLASGELNALVVDVKGDLGYVAYPSAVPLVERIGANDVITIPEPESLLASLKVQGVYTVARIVVFKDDLLARNGPRAGLNLAVTDAASGEVWTDVERLGWVDPFREEVWDYNIALAEEAIRKGFDEIQFDFVRFPTDPGEDTLLAHAVFSHVPTAERRPQAIASFLSRARQAIHAAGGALGADVFGFVCWAEDDLGIGQHLETLAAAVDYVHPMVYPSTFSGLPMEPAYADSPTHPYETIYYSLERARDRVVGTGVAIRPWLQYFDDYPWASGQPYGPDELAEQRQAVADLGLPGWMWWDPTNHYRHGSGVQSSP